MFIKIFLFLSVITLLGCAKQKVSEEGLRKYISDPENGLIQTSEVNGAKITATYHPTDLIIAQELKRFDKINARLIDSLKNYYRQSIYFILSLSKDNQEIENQYLYDKNLYTQILQHLNYYIAEDLKLVADTITISFMGHTYPRMYSTTGKSALMLAFKKDSSINYNDLDLIYNDKKLGLGRNSFHFKKKDLEDIPSLE